jgi:hypothetical protein
VDLEQIREFARNAHGDQLDKAGRDYFLYHVTVVAYGVAPFGHGIESAAWLHDVVEDTKVNLRYLRALKVSEPIVEMVDVLTCPPGMARHEYYDRLSRNYGALLVKVSDVCNNSDPTRLALLDDATRFRLERKYAKARMTLFPLLDPHDLAHIVRRVAPSLNNVLERKDA